jgi:hypothetical protein
MKLTISILLLCFAATSLAEDFYTKDALKKTQELLRDRQKRNVAAKANPKAREADDKASALAGSEKNRDEMYNIAAGVMEKLVEETGGDDKKMQEILKRAEKDPEGFYRKMFSEEMKAKADSLANDISEPPKAGPDRP